MTQQTSESVYMLDFGVGATDMFMCGRCVAVVPGIIQSDLGAPLTAEEITDNGITACEFCRRPLGTTLSQSGPHTSAPNVAEPRATSHQQTPFGAMLFSAFTDAQKESQAWQAAGMPQAVIQPERSAESGDPWFQIGDSVLWCEWDMPHVTLYQRVRDGGDEPSCPECGVKWEWRWMNADRDTRIIDRDSADVDYTYEARSVVVCGNCNHQFQAVRS